MGRHKIKFSSSNKMAIVKYYLIGYSLESIGEKFKVSRYVIKNQLHKKGIIIKSARYKKGDKIRLGKKHTKESKKKMSNALKGRKAWNKGKKYSSKIYNKIFSESAQKKRSEALKNRKLSESHIKKLKNRKVTWGDKISKSKKGKHLSFNTRIAISLANSKNLKFNGFKQHLNKRIRNLPMYGIWRNQIFERDNYTCQRCGKKGCFIEAHHKKGLAKILKMFSIDNLEKAIDCNFLWDINNGITYCNPCHIKNDIHRKRVRGMV